MWFICWLECFVVEWLGVLVCFIKYFRDFDGVGRGVVLVDGVGNVVLVVGWVGVFVVLVGREVDGDYDFFCVGVGGEVILIFWVCYGGGEVGEL